jgi:hypothetical protein
MKVLGVPETGRNTFILISPPFVPVFVLQEVIVPFADMT